MLPVLPRGANRRSEREQNKLACYAEPQGGKGGSALIPMPVGGSTSQTGIAKPDTTLPLAVLPAFGGIADSTINYLFAPFQGATGVYINFTLEARLLTLYPTLAGG